MPLKCARNIMENSKGDSVFMYNKKYREEIDNQLGSWSLEDRDIIIDLLHHIDNLTDIGSELARQFVSYDREHKKFCTYCLGDETLPHSIECAANNWNKLVDA